MSQPTYSFVAGDGQTYGPNPLETIQTWIVEGRIARDTQMSRSDVEGWFKAGDFQEFTWPAGATATLNPSPVFQHAPQERGRATLDQLDPGAVAQMRNHASWFYWIAGIGLIFGLIGAFGDGGAGAAGLVFTIPIVLFSAVIGYFACKAHLWAFIVGLLFLALLLVNAVLDRHWIGVAIRIWAIVEVFKGFMIARELRRSLRG